jgi:hypothetical protein
MNWSDFDDYNGDDKSTLQRIFDDQGLSEPQQTAILTYVKSYGTTAFGVALCLGFVVGLALGGL